MKVFIQFVYEGLAGKFESVRMKWKGGEVLEYAVIYLHCTDSEEEKREDEERIILKETVMIKNAKRKCLRKRRQNILLSTPECLSCV